MSEDAKFDPTRNLIKFALKHNRTVHLLGVSQKPNPNTVTNSYSTFHSLYRTNIADCSDFTIP